ncbi:MAG: VWA domain-containing protein [Cardiobacteriaceae bacterium]|nr:VWA domain-containing protein [Cardiobacteriaceae bacterium]
MRNPFITIAILAASASAFANDKAARCEDLRLAPAPQVDIAVKIASGQPMPRQKMVNASSAPLSARDAANAKLKEALGFEIAIMEQGRYHSAIPLHNTENYAHHAPNPVQRVADNAVSTFSIDVDTGSYANVRRYLNDGTLPPADAVRIEEIVNYFHYDYALPQDGKPFAVHTQVVDSPWQANAKLLKIALQAADLAKDKLPPANLVFLIDTSGSMDSDDKLGLAQQTVCLFAAELRKEDTLTLITYAGHVQTLLEPTAGDEFERIYKALQQLSAHGSTAGESAIRMAYDAAEKHFKKGGINRILLATDGDFNVGVSDTEALKTLVADKRNAGISLSTLGFGSGNYNDELMEQIADVGDGNYSYIDSLHEAKKVLVRQLSSTLATIARDVKIQIEFNPATVREYRLVGYENRVLREEDFNNDQVDAGDIGAGHRVTAFYELIPAGEKGWLDDKRYQPAPAASGNGGEYAYIKLRYKTPGNDASQLLETPVPAQSLALDQADTDTRFAIAAAAYAQALKGGAYNGAMDWAGIHRLAEAAQGDDRFGERRELLKLLEKAQSLSAKK